MIDRDDSASYNDLLVELRKRRCHSDVLVQMGWFRDDTTFCSLNLTDEQRDTLGKACELSMLSVEDTIAEALHCWLDYKAACKRSRKYEVDSQTDGRFGLPIEAVDELHDGMED